jgi:hypothetical protein
MVQSCNFNLLAGFTKLNEVLLRCTEDRDGRQSALAISQRWPVPRSAAYSFSHEPGNLGRDRNNSVVYGTVPALGNVLLGVEGVMNELAFFYGPPRERIAGWIGMTYPRRQHWVREIAFRAEKGYYLNEVKDRVKVTKDWRTLRSVMGSTWGGDMGCLGI